MVEVRIYRLMVRMEGHDEAFFVLLQATDPRARLELERVGKSNRPAVAIAGSLARGVVPLE